VQVSSASKMDEIENYLSIFHMCFLANIYCFNTIYFQKVHTQLFIWYALKCSPSDPKIEEGPIYLQLVGKVLLPSNTQCQIKIWQIWSVWHFRRIWPFRWYLQIFIH